MKIDILTLFPDMFYGFLNESIIKRAREKGLVTINVHNIRDYSSLKNKQVDDYGYGGGPGMVLMPQPIFDCVEAIRTSESKVILMTPQGKVHTQENAVSLSHEKHLIFICGHYTSSAPPCNYRTVTALQISSPISPVDLFSLFSPAQIRCIMPIVTIKVFYHPRHPGGLSHGLQQFTQSRHSAGLSAYGQRSGDFPRRGLHSASDARLRCCRRTGFRHSKLPACLPDPRRWAPHHPGQPYPRPRHRFGPVGAV